MSVSASDAIALLALFVSALAAFYAKQAVDTARFGNRINLHEPRAKIFQAIFDYRRLFVALDAHPNDDEMQDFYLKVVLPSHIYLPTRFTERLYKLYLNSRTLFDKIVACEEGACPDSKWEYINALQDLGGQELDLLIQDLATELDLGST